MHKIKALCSGEMRGRGRGGEGGGRGGGITSARRGGGFGEDISGSNTTPQLAFGTRFTPSPSRNKTNAKKKYGKSSERQSKGLWYTI